MGFAQIHVRFSEQGFHSWPGAPARRIYLSNTHRHLFVVEVTTTVNHDDREIEFHDLRDQALALFRQQQNVDGNFGEASCEMIARRLGADLARAHARSFTVAVFEDGEFGATVVCHPDENAQG